MKEENLKFVNDQNPEHPTDKKALESPSLLFVGWILDILLNTDDNAGADKTEAQQELFTKMKEAVICGLKSPVVGVKSQVFMLLSSIFSHLGCDLATKFITVCCRL